MKICLVNANMVLEGSPSDLAVVDFQSGLLSCAAVLEKAGYEVELVDLSWLARRRSFRIDGSFPGRAAEYIAGRRAGLIGFNTRCDTYPFVLDVAVRCKKMEPGVPVVLGGPQATLTAEETLAGFPGIDAVVRGEGELTIVELAGRVREGKGFSGIAGISFREGGRVVRNRDRELIADLDSLPPPAYHLMERYIRGERGLLKDCRIYVQAGRGCPYGCAFCASGLLFNGRYRLRSPEAIVREMEFLKKEYGSSQFILGHDHLLRDRVFASELCRLLKRRKTGVSWICSSRVDAVDPGLLRTAAEAGCRGICFGIESGSPRILRRIGKKLDLSRIPGAVDACEKNGITAGMSFIIGFPDETKKDIARTLELVLHYAACHYDRARPLVRLLSPMAGTAVLRENRRRLEFTGYWSEMSDSPFAALAGYREMIRAHPGLFSSFHVLRPRAMSCGELYWIVVLFSYLIHTYPISFHAASQELGLRPLALMRRFSARPVSLAQCVRAFPVFLKREYAARGIPFTFTRQLLKMEKTRCLRIASEGRKIVSYIKEKRYPVKRRLLRRIISGG